MQPKVNPIKPFSLPKVHEEAMPNGATLLTYSGGSTDACSLTMLWPAGICEGFRLCPSSLVPMVAVQMLCEGAGGMSGMQIAEALDFGGAMFNADADSHHSVANMTMLTRMAGGMLPLLRTIVAEPDFPEQALQAVLERNYHQHLLAQKKVGFLARQAMAELIYGPNHPLAYVLKQQDFEAVTRQSLFDFHSQAYIARGCTAMLAGRYSPQMLEDTKRMLSSLPQGLKAVEPYLVPFDTQAPQERVVYKEDALQSAVRIAIPAPPRTHPDYLMLRFAVQALGGYFGSRLMKNIREEKGYTYGIHAALEGHEEGAAITISADCANEHVRPLLQEVRLELERLAAEPMPADELERLRQFAATSLMEVLETPFSIMDYHRVIRTYGLPASYFDDQVRIILTATPADIQRVASLYLLPSQMRIAIAGSPRL